MGKKNKTVVITGGTRGLGIEMAKCFRNNGYNTVICGTSNSSVEKAIAELRELISNGEVYGMVCDVSNIREVEALAQYALEQCGKIDIWINNAGVNQSYKFAWEIDENEIEYLLKVDLKGTINGTTVAIRMMKEQKSGAIYNVEGMGSNDAFQPRLAIYGTAKRAITYFTDAIAKEAEAEKIPVIIGKLSPGIMITDFLTSSNGKQGAINLTDKVKKVYNILGDYPDVIADFLVRKMILNKKNGVRISWLTNKKATFRFMTSFINKRDFFTENSEKR